MYNPFQTVAPRLTKNVAEQAIAYYLGGQVTQFTFARVSNIPSAWKHACLGVGVEVFQPAKIPYNPQFGVFIDFICCPACRKVIYYYEDNR